MKIPIRQTVLGVTAAVAIVSPFFFGERSRLNLSEVHPDLRIVAECAIRETPNDFTVIDGMRTEEEQRKNVSNGRSWTLRSRHLEGKAIDFALAIKGKVVMNDKLYPPEIYYPPIAESFNGCSRKLGIPIIWGGEWKVRDWGHIELDRREYP